MSDPRHPAVLPPSTLALTCAGAVFMLAGVALQLASRTQIRIGPVPLYEAVMGIGALCEVVAAFRIRRWLIGRRSTID